jgi:hypothetical protein
VIYLPQSAGVGLRLAVNGRRRCSRSPIAKNCPLDAPSRARLGVPAADDIGDELWDAYTWGIAKSVNLDN